MHVYGNLSAGLWQEMPQTLTARKPSPVEKLKKKNENKNEEEKQKCNVSGNVQA